jgi:hypothetical protein
MPPLPAAPSTAKIQLHGIMGTDTDVLNTFHCQFTGAPQVQDMNDWALAVSNAWNAHLADLVASDYTLSDVICTDLTSDIGAIGQNAQNYKGTATGNSVPAGVSLIMQFGISRRYRGGHPRQYIAGVASSSLQNENQWSATAISAWEAAYNLFMGAVKDFYTSNVTGTNIVNVSYVKGHTWTQDARGNWHRVPVYRDAPVFDIVGAYTVNPTVGSMRRRNEQP